MIKNCSLILPVLLCAHLERGTLWSRMVRLCMLIPGTYVADGAQVFRTHVRAHGSGYRGHLTEKLYSDAGL